MIPIIISLIIMHKIIIPIFYNLYRWYLSYFDLININEVQYHQINHFKFYFLVLRSLKLLVDIIKYKHSLVQKNYNLAFVKL